MSPQVFAAIIGGIFMLIMFYINWSFSSRIKDNEETITKNMKNISQNQKQIAVILEKIITVEKLTKQKFKNAESQRDEILKRINKLNGYYDES